MFQITIDNREQNPFRFAGYPAALVAGTLNAGDYSLPGFADRVAVERKSLSDLIGCLTHDRERFRRELEKLRGYESAAVVVESSFADLTAGRYRSKLNPASAVQSVIALMQEFRMPFFFAGSRAEAEHFTFDFLRHFARHAETRYRAISAMLGTSSLSARKTGEKRSCSQSGKTDAKNVNRAQNALKTQINGIPAPLQSADNGIAVKPTHIF